MKKFIFIFFIIIFSGYSAYSEVSFNGELKTVLNAKIKNGNYLYNEENLLLKTKFDLSDSLAGFSSFNVRYQNFPVISKTSDLNNRENIEPFEIYLNEAYIDYYGFLSDKIDFRIGKQRIAWGTADKMNPTDNLNPDDLTYIFDFGEKIPTISAKAVFYISDVFSLQGIWLPYFTPAKFSDNVFNYSEFINENLKTGIEKELATKSLSVNANVTGNTVSFPESKTKNGMFAFKFAGKVLDFDFSLSYFKGFDDVPIINAITVDGQSILSGKVDINYNMVYPKMQVIGFDTAGEIFSIGVWAEVAYFTPEEIKTITTLELPLLLGGTSYSTNTLLDKEPYFKYTIGLDYTFKNGLYVNSQFIHGFFTERGYKDEKPQDYIVARIENKFFEDKIKLGISGSVEMKDLNKADSFEYIRKNSGNMWGVDATYYPVDNTELSIGVITIQGSEETFFGRLQENDQLYLKAKLYF